MINPVITEDIDTLTEYLNLIVDPTFEEYKRNPHSARHAFLSCVAIFHSIDRATHPKSSANLRKSWQNESVEFLVVDMFAHRLKHVRSGHEKQPTTGKGLPLSALVENMDFHNLYYAMRDAIKFIRRKANKQDAS